MSEKYRNKSSATRGKHLYDAYEADVGRPYDSFSDLYDDFEGSRSKTPFVIIGALLAVAIVGGGVAFVYKTGASDGNDGPAVVLAERTPTKVDPEDPGGIKIPHQDRQIYESVSGQRSSIVANEDNLSKPDSVNTVEVRSQEEELNRAGFSPKGEAGAELKNARLNNDLPLTIGALANRNIENIPSLNSSVEFPPTVPAMPILSAEPLSELPKEFPTGIFKPRRVQTVTIGADGSIITNDTPETLNVVDGARNVRTLTTLPAEVPPLSEVISDGSDVGAVSILSAGVDQKKLTEQTAFFSPSPRPRPRPITRLAARTPAAAAVRPKIPAAATSAASARALVGFAVQVAAYREQAEAVELFADLRQRYPGLISGLQPLIQRAEIPGKGIYYRLRIGPVADKGDAKQLCASLKNAGWAGCLVKSL